MIDNIAIQFVLAPLWVGAAWLYLVALRRPSWVREARAERRRLSRLGTVDVRRRL